MSNEQTPTPIDELVNRLATKIGQLTTENEWLRVQLEMAQKAAQQEPMMAQTMNGHQADNESAYQGGAPI